jgi:pimeloyl-ACP methyl ester carboxylesterase
MNLLRSLGGLIAALWRRIAPTNARRVLVVSAVFAPLIALGAYQVQQQPAPPAAKPASAASAADTRPTDPVARFAETGIGQVLFWPHGSDTCRRVLFDNRTGASQEVGEVLCEPDKSDETVRAEINRLTTLRKSFKK